MHIVKWGKLAFFLSALLLINVATSLITSANQKAGFYSVNDDSIGIPIVLTLYVSFCILPILFVICLIPNKGLLVWLKSKGAVFLIAVRVGFLLLYAVAFCVAVYGITYWSFPHHYLIAASYVILFVFLLISFAFDFGKLGHKSARE